MKRSKDWWDTWYMNMAAYVSTASKDPSTKCGAVIVRPNKTIASIGYNGLPRNIPDTPGILEDRETKYACILHAEENALANCEDRNVEGYSVYTYPFMPCSKCASNLINRGVAAIIAPETKGERGDRWKSSFSFSTKMFEKAGVDIQLIKWDSQWDIIQRLLVN